MTPLGIRGKLILIFVLIKVLPLIALAWFAWNQVAGLGQTVSERTAELSDQTQMMVSEVGTLATQDSITALDIKSREAIERLTTDTARQVAAFLHERDNDILQVAGLPVDTASYKRFLAPRKRAVILHQPWAHDEATDSWQPLVPATVPPNRITANNADNAKDFHARLPERPGNVDLRPLYHEMTFVGLDGKERIKISQSDLLSAELRDVSSKANTFLGAESYFQALQRLAPGEIYVSEVIGEYVPGHLIGPYTKAKAEAAEKPFAPQDSGYAGKENPVGKRFEGIIRWATPVLRGGEIAGYVTLALDHTHVMEFTDHIIPTDERYSPISDASSGNYAFMWDYKGRNISHPRDYFIVGYDAKTGNPAVPWLDEALYEQYKKTGEDIMAFQANTPQFHEQSLKKKPSKELIRQGMVALDGRYLNFAPQCTGWHNLTQEGGSGSFVIFWSGLWKLTTAAAIPYHTGIYGEHPRGFGYVTIGANVHEFHRAATETAKRIESMTTGYKSDLDKQNQATQQSLARTLETTAQNLSLSTALMIFVVILIAIWMASTLTRKITSMITGVRQFQQGDMDARLDPGSQDEMGQLARAFNDMSDSVQQAFGELTQAEARYRNIVEHATAGIFQSTLAGQFISVNPALAHMLRYDSPNQLLSEISDLATEFYANPNYRSEFISRLIEQGTTTNEEFMARRRDGTLGSFTANTRLVRDENGAPAYLEGMILDISDRKDKEQAEQQKKMAEAASLAKSEFLARMSHEIRTPMNAVVGVADILEGYDLDSEQKVLVNLLKSSSDNLLTLIDDILDLSKIEAGKLTLEEAAFDLREEVATLCSLLGNRAYEKKLYFDYALAPEVPRIVLGDQARIRQVLTNLLGNAIKFTTKGEICLHVSVAAASPEETTIQFQVKDTGVGIPADMISAIFESFGQVDSSITRRFGGSGLGLAISKNLVDLMHGTIHATSQLDEGSLFTVTLPLPPLPVKTSPTGADGLDLGGTRILVADDYNISRNRISDLLTRCGAETTATGTALETLEHLRGFKRSKLPVDMVFVSSHFRDANGIDVAKTIIKDLDMAGKVFLMLTATELSQQTQAIRELPLGGTLIKPINEAILASTLIKYQQGLREPSRSVPEETAVDSPLRLLVVDDAEDNRNILSQFLMGDSFEVDMAEDGLLALQLFQKNRYDVVLLDMQMPVMDGYTAVERMRQHEQERGVERTPIIALTAHAMGEDRQKCLRSGCDDYLSKPVRKASLLEMIRKHQ